jgi:hypothetical protein
MRITLPLLFNQMDSRWGQKLLGFNKDPKYNFYNFACLICCEAMVSRYYGFDETPVTINDKLVNLGPGNGFVAGSGNYVYGSISKLHSEISEEVVYTPAPLTDGQLGEIRQHLDDGHPVMFQIDVNPRTVENDTHFVLVVDYNPEDENDFTIADPLGGQHRSLKEYLGWFRPGVRQSVEKFILFSGPKQNLSTGCLLSNTGENQKVYEKLVHNSTEWDKTVGEYLPDTDPSQKRFEDVRAVISGYKSRVTDLEKQRDEAKEQTALALKEVENQKEKVANVQEACQRSLELKDAELSSYLGTAKTIEKLRGEYTARITSLEDELREAQKAKGVAGLAQTAAETKLDQCERSQQTSEKVSVIVRLLEALFGPRNA